MARTRFDQLSKQLLEEFLTPLGKVEKSLEVLGEARFVDIWFVPFAQPAMPPAAIGLLGKLATTPCLLEPFRNQPTLTEVRNCLLKLFLVQADFQRKAKRGEVSEAFPQEGRIPEAELPQLWILTSSASDTILSGFGANPHESWTEGVSSFWQRTSEPLSLRSIASLKRQTRFCCGFWEKAQPNSKPSAKCWHCLWIIPNA